MCSCIFRGLWPLTLNPSAGAPGALRAHTAAEAPSCRGLRRDPWRNSTTTRLRLEDRWPLRPRQPGALIPKGKKPTKWIKACLILQKLSVDPCRSIGELTFPLLLLGTQNSVLLLGPQKCAVPVAALRPGQRLLGMNPLLPEPFAPASSHGVRGQPTDTFLAAAAHGLGKQLRRSVCVKGPGGKALWRYFCPRDGFETPSWLVISTLENTATPMVVFLVRGLSFPGL